MCSPDDSMRIRNISPILWYWNGIASAISFLELGDHGSSQLPLSVNYQLLGIIWKSSESSFPLPSLKIFLPIT